MNTLDKLKQKQAVAYGYTSWEELPDHLKLHCWNFINETYALECIKAGQLV